MMRHAALLLLLALLTGALYVRTLDDPWHYDDQVELTPAVKAFAPHADPSHYRGNTVRWLWALDYRLHGDNPRGYHVTNTLIHLGTGVALYWVAWMLAAGLPRRRRFLAAAAAAALFTAHPLATQSVTYLTQRSTSLASLLFLLALGGWLTYRGQAGGRRWIAAAGTLAGFFLGVHAKPVVLTLPAAIVAYEWLVRPPHRRRDGWLLFPLVFLALWRVVELAPAADLARPGAEAPNLPAVPSERNFSANEYALTQTVSVATYLRLAVIPRGQTLLRDLLPARSLFDPRVLGSVALLAALLVAALRVRRRHPIVAFGIFLFFLALLPTSSFLRSPGLFFEHRAYLPLAGLCLAAGAGLAGATRIPLRLAAGLAAAAVLVLAGLTVRRNAVWATELSLWTDVVRKAPGRVDARTNLALALQRAGRLREAESEYRRALVIRPDDASAHNNLGNVLAALDRPDEAARELEAAAAARPTWAEPRMNLGNVAMQRGDAPAAERYYREALALASDSDGLRIRANLARCLMAQRRPDEAIAEYRRLDELLADDAALANDYGCALLMTGDAAGAEPQLLRAVALRPDWADAWRNLAAALDALGRAREAEAARARAE